MKFRYYFLLIALMATSITGLYYTEAETDAIRAEVAQLDAQLEQAEASLLLLEAEWSYLTTPTRLSELTKTHQLAMGYTQAEDIRHASSIPLRPVMISRR